MRFYGVLTARSSQAAPFEWLKKELAKRSAKTAESTIRNWLPPLSLLRQDGGGGAVRRVDWENLTTPDLAQLCEVASLLNVSMDYLIGEDVPQRLTDRKQVGNLAREFLAHVVRDYERRTSGGSEFHRRRRDGLAFAIGGHLKEGQPTPRPKKRGDPLPSVNVGDVLEDGGIITNRGLAGLQVLKADPQIFLARVCDRIATEADQWETDHVESEWEAVRRDIAKLRPHAAEIAAALRDQTHEPATEAIVNDRLLKAALDPSDARAVADVILFREYLEGYRKREERWTKVLKTFEGGPDAKPSEQARTSRKRPR